MQRVLFSIVSLSLLVVGCSRTIDQATVHDYNIKCQKKSGFDKYCDGSFVQWDGDIVDINVQVLTIYAIDSLSSEKIQFFVDSSKFYKSEFVVGRAVKISGVLRRSEGGFLSSFTTKVDASKITFLSKKSTAIRAEFRRQCGEGYNIEAHAEMCTDAFSGSFFSPKGTDGLIEGGSNFEDCAAKVRVCRDLNTEYNSALAEEASSNKSEVNIERGLPKRASISESSNGNQQECADTTISFIGSRIEGQAGSGSVVRYRNGAGQITYGNLLEIEESVVGDPVEVCVNSRPKYCPAGDDRGITYKVTNRRTNSSWIAPNSEHECGGT